MGADDECKYGVSKRTGDREPVFRDEKDDPFTRTSLISFFAVIYNYEARSDRELTLNFGETVQYWNSAAVGFVFPKGGLTRFSPSLSLLEWYRVWSLSKKDVLVKFDAFCEFAIVIERFGITSTLTEQSSSI